MVEIEKFLTRVDKYAKRSGRKPGGIGRELFGDAKVLPRLRAGWRGISLERLTNADAQLKALEAGAAQSAKKNDSALVA